MPDWKQSDLCLCHSPNVASTGHCFRNEKLQWTNGVARRPPMAGQTDLPLQEICDEALLRHKKRRQSQVLLLYDGAAAEDVRAAQMAGTKVWLRAVEVCSLDQIGHPDILLALAMGFDRVILQKLTPLDARAQQEHEVDLALALGGRGRVAFFSSLHCLEGAIAAVPKTSGRWRKVQPARATRRRASVRSCVAVLLPSSQAPVPLPVDAPYGSVSLNTSACTKCQSCVWLCPTDALSISDRTGDLELVESLCIQCGMCCSMCPTDALRLDPRMAPLSTAETGRPLEQPEPAHCVQVDKPIEIKTMLEKFAIRIWGDPTSAEV